MVMKRLEQNERIEIVHINTEEDSTGRETRMKLLQSNLTLLKSERNLLYQIG